MRLVVRLTWVFTLLVVPIVGCNEVTPPTTAPLALTISGPPAPGEERVPLEGAWVCETDTTNCVMTDANGGTTIELPIDEESSYTIEKEGYDPYLIAQIMPATGRSNWWGMRTVETTADRYESVMSPYPRFGTGEILIVLRSEFVGATFDLVGATGVAYYHDEQDEDFNWRLDLAATTSAGSGGFIEVPPGTFRVKFGGTADNCVRGPASGWPGDIENSIRVLVREGYQSYVIPSCPPP